MNRYPPHIMKKLLFAALILPVGFCHAQTQISQLPTLTQINRASEKIDWLVHKSVERSGVYKSADGKEIILYNGLLKRTFRIQPNVACVDFVNQSSGEQMLRAVEPEARLIINGKPVNIGGLYGQKEKAYLLKEWVNDLKAHEQDFQYKGFTVSQSIQTYVKWHPRLWARNKQLPTGKTLTFIYSGSDQLKDLTVKVNYEIYDGIPLICKWISVENKSKESIRIDNAVNEILATPEEESAVVGKVDQMKIPHSIYIESNYAFNNAMKADLSDQTTHWKADSTYTSQVNYDYNTPCVLEVYPGFGTGVKLQPGEIFYSIRTYELLFDSYDRERNGLAQRTMYRTIAPWTTENPIFMHLVSSDPEKVKNCIDQCVATGYEGLILSFGSGLNMEDTSATNVTKFKELADYAHSKGILIGGYSLFSSRRISDEDDVIDPKTGKPDLNAMFGHAPCLGSKWGLAYLSHIKYFIANTSFDIFENDGPYPGDVCASTTHPGHEGLMDSQWQQMELQKGLYRWLNERGVYVMLETETGGKGGHGHAAAPAPAAKPAAPAGPKAAAPAAAPKAAAPAAPAAPAKSAEHKTLGQNPNRQLFKRSTYSGYKDIGPVAGETFEQKVARLRELSAAAKRRSEEGGGEEHAAETTEAVEATAATETPAAAKSEAPAHKATGNADRTLMKRGTYCGVEDTGPVPGETFEQKVARLAKVSAAAKQRAEGGE